MNPREIHVTGDFGEYNLNNVILMSSTGEVGREIYIGNTVRDISSTNTHFIY